MAQLPPSWIGDAVEPEMVVGLLVGPLQQTDADLEEGAARRGRVEAGDAPFFGRTLDVVVPQRVARLQPGGAELLAEETDGGEDPRVIEARTAVVAVL